MTNIKVGLMYSENTWPSPIDPSIVTGWSNYNSIDDEDALIAQSLLKDGGFDIFNLIHEDISDGIVCKNLRNLGTGENSSNVDINDSLDVLFFRGFGSVEKNRASRKIVNDMLGNMKQKLSIPTINPVVTVLKYRDSGKAYLLELSKKGIPIPETHIVTSPRDIDEIGKEFASYVIKPLTGFGGFSVERFPGGDISRVYEVLEKDGAVMVQEYVTEIETLGERSLVIFGEDLKYSFIKKPKGKEFRTNYEKWCDIDLYGPSKQEKELARDSIAAMEIDSLLTRVDVSGSRERPKLMEVTKSCTGLYPRELGAEDIIMGYIKQLIVDVVGDGFYGNPERN